MRNTLRASSHSRAVVICQRVVSSDPIRIVVSIELSKKGKRPVHDQAKTAARIEVTNFRKKHHQIVVRSDRALQNGYPAAAR